MQHTPMSANTKAPASRESYLDWGSVTIAAVRPTPELPFPDVYIPLGVNLATCFRSCDLAIPGSPISATLIYPLILTWSGVSLVTPPTIIRSNAFLT